MVMAAYYQNRRMPPRPACGLHEDEPIEPQYKPQKIVPSFPLSVFPIAIRNIVEALVRYEHFNINFISASMFTTFAAADRQIDRKHHSPFQPIRLHTGTIQSLHLASMHRPRSPHTPRHHFHPLRKPRMGSRQTIPLRPHLQPTIRHPTHYIVQLISVASTTKSTKPTSRPASSDPKSVLHEIKLTFVPCKATVLAVSLLCS